LKIKGVIIVFFMAILLIYGTLDMPKWASEDTPPNTHVSPYIFAIA